MKIKIGDLVYVGRQSDFSTRHNNEIWLVLGYSERTYSGFIRVQNIHTSSICQYNEGMLMKIETDKL